MSFWTDLAEFFVGGPDQGDVQEVVDTAVTGSQTVPINLNVSQEEAQARAAPLLAAIQGLASFQRPQVREATFARDAEAGFGLSGRAVENVGRALGAFDAETEAKRQTAIAQAFRDILGERQFEANLQTQQEANRLARLGN